MTFVPGGEYGPGAFVAVRLGVAGILSFGPAALALGVKSPLACSGRTSTIVSVAWRTVVRMLRLIVEIERRSGRSRSVAHVDSEAASVFTSIIPSRTCGLVPNGVQRCCSRPAMMSVSARDARRVKQ